MWDWFFRFSCLEVSKWVAQPAGQIAKKGSDRTCPYFSLITYFLAQLDQKHTRPGQNSPMSFIPMIYKPNLGLKHGPIELANIDTSTLGIDDVVKTLADYRF